MISSLCAVLLVKRMTFLAVVVFTNPFIMQVSRLQEQLQAERDLRAALEAGLSMSSGQFSSSRGMDSKV